MNQQEMLLVQLAEECNEVAQEIAKILRFGLNDSHPLYSGSNRDRLSEEFNDILAITEMLEDHHGIDFSRYSGMIEGKKIKVAKYLEVSRKLGTLT